MNNYTQTIPPYVGITDFENGSQARNMVELVPYNHRRSIMVGIMMSYKTLRGIPTSKGWEKIWPKPGEIDDIFIDHPRALNTLHYADYDGKTSYDDLFAAVAFCGRNIKAIQLDMIWPSPSLVLELVGSPVSLPVILQIGQNAFDRIANDPRQMIRRLAEYSMNGCSALSGVLLDRSMGKGKGMDAKSLRPFIEILFKERPDLRIAVAGGLGPTTLDLVRPLMDEFPDLSIDAQGQLRDDGDSTKPINWLRAHDYIRKSLEMFP